MNGHCSKCYNLLNADGNCETCFVTALNGVAYCNPYRSVIARNYHFDTYPEFCTVCAILTLHRTIGMTCTRCTAAGGSKYAQVRSAPRCEARRARRPTYEEHCPIHGRTAHHVTVGKCTSCFNAAGAVRPQVHRANPARSLARRQGEQTYQDRCVEHGKGPHWVLNGKCSICVTTTGAPRTAAPSDPLRIIARQAGHSRYKSFCATHGITDHHTIRGKCLQCFNTLGYPRKQET